MRPVWRLHPAFFRGSYPLLRVFRYSARAEVTHRLILPSLDGAARDGREEIETSDPYGGTSDKRDPRASAENYASDF